MKKINTETKLRITNNKTKLISEATPTGAYEQFKDATGAKEAVGIIKNLGKTSLAITKYFGLNLLPTKALGQQLKNVVWHGKKFKWGGFVDDYKKFAKKGYDQFNKDVDDLVKDHENNFKNMLTSGMGMTEGEAAAMLAIGSPPIAIMNKLYDLSKNKRGGEDVDNFKDIQRLDELVPHILYFYITGKDPRTDEEPGELLREITTEYNKYMKVVGQNSKEILKNLHRKEYYKRHFKSIKNIVKSIDDNFNFDLNVAASIDDAASKIVSGDISRFLEDFKSYCDENNEKLESYSRKSLNLKTMLIKEQDDDIRKKEDETFDQMEVHNFGVILAFIFIVMNKDKIKELLVNVMSGVNIAAFNKVLKDRDTIIECMLVFYLFWLRKHILTGLAKKYIDNSDYDFNKEGIPYYEKEYKANISSFDDDYKRFFILAKKEDDINKVLEKQGATSGEIGNAIAIFLCAPETLQDDEKIIGLFKWDKLNSTRVTETLFATSLAGKGDVPFLKAVQQQLNSFNKDIQLSMKTGKDLKLKLDEKFKPSGGGGSSTGS